MSSSPSSCHFIGRGSMTSRGRNMNGCPSRSTPPKATWRRSSTLTARRAPDVTAAPTLRAQLPYLYLRKMADRNWRNHMRKMLILFKGAQPSTSPGAPGSTTHSNPNNCHPTGNHHPPPHQLDDEPPF